MSLVRFGVSVPEELLTPFDALCTEKNYPNRSEAIRDLIRKSLIDEAWNKEHNQAAGTLTILYDHHKNDIMRRLTKIQHTAHDLIVAVLHVHLDHDNCLEVLILRGNALKIKALANTIIACKGVKHGIFAPIKAE